MSIEKLHVLPTHEKVEDGYAYNEKFVGNVYQYKDSLLFFKDKTYLEFPIKIFEEYKKIVIDEIVSNLSEIEIKIDQLFEDVDNIKSEQTYLHKLLEQINNQIQSYIEKEEFNNIKSQINKLETTQSLINVITPETINLIIDKKLTEVYNNFNSVTQKLVTDAIAEALKDSKRDQAGKLKMTTLLMAKEIGLTPDEIVKYSESGLL